MQCEKCGEDVEVIVKPVFRSHPKHKYVCKKCGHIKEWVEPYRIEVRSGVEYEEKH